MKKRCKSCEEMRNIDYEYENSEKETCIYCEDIENAHKKP